MVFLVKFSAFKLMEPLVVVNESMNLRLLDG